MLLFGGPILFLLAQGWYFWYVLQIRPRLRLATSAALALAGLVSLAAPAYVALILVAAGLTALAILDQP